MRSRSQRRKSTPIEVPTGRVTGITPSVRAVGRFDLAIGGESVARLSIESVERLRLEIGIDVDAAGAAAIGAEAEVVRVYDRAMAMLAVHGRATGELRRLLVQRKELPTVVDRVIDRLHVAGFLDDEAFVRQFIRYRAVAAGQSRRRIEQDLGRRGIGRAMAAAAIEAIFRDEGVDETAAIDRAAEKKLRTMSGVDEPAKRRRLYGFLVRRGYDGDAIRRVMRQATWGDASEG